MGEVMIPPWVRPESPETIRWIDDATQAFQPAFGRGTTQRGIWADPRWGLRRRYRGLRSDEKAAILNALNETRGQLNILRVTPHAPLRGSMPTGELLANNTFASGTTGWTGGSDATISVADRVLRVVRSAITGATGWASQSVSGLTTYVPYVGRVMVVGGRGTQTLGCALSFGPFNSATSSTPGLQTVVVVPTSTSGTFYIENTTSSGPLAGDYFLVPYTSLTRCAVVDNGQNLLQRSDEFDNAYWTKTRSSISANGQTAPDGTATADFIVEDSTASASHNVNRDVTVSSAAADYAFTVALRAGTRSWALLGLGETTGGTSVSAYFNLSTGAVGTVASGANFTNARAFVQNMGNGWLQCTIVGRKTNAATTLTVAIYVATGDGVFSYSGNGTSNIAAWRATLSQSSLPVRLVQTTSAASSGASQTGSALYTKGWPASTNGLLLAGDQFEINGELKQITAPVNSDAAGLAYMQFRPALAGSPADNDPIIIHEPFGRFIYPQGTRELENLFGIYGDCEMNLEEVYV
jgi:hypothetical protein